VYLWDVNSGRLLQTFLGHTSEVASVAFSPDGRFALSAGWDGDDVLRLWQLPEAGSGQAFQPERGAFVLLGGKGVPERKFDTLAAAVQAASDGDSIEIRGNGPFISAPISIERAALTIRAGVGFRPVIKHSPETITSWVPLLSTRAALVLEGLELHQGSPADKHNVEVVRRWQRYD
jgi:WD40 repeat protein